MPLPEASTPPPLPPTPPRPAALVEVEALNRVFGSVHAVRDLSFTIPRGGAVGFIGANGAGKTTTMRIMATLDDPTSGRVVTQPPRNCRLAPVSLPTLCASCARRLVCSRVAVSRATSRAWALAASWASAAAATLASASFFACHAAAPRTPPQRVPQRHKEQPVTNDT